MKKILILLSSLIIPGSGYFLLGHKVKGFLLFCLIVPAYLFGAYLTDFSLYFLEKHSFYFVLHFFIGFPCLIFYYPFPDPILLISLPNFLEIGFIYMSITSLLNILSCSKIYFKIFSKN